MKYKLVVTPQVRGIPIVGKAITSEIVDIGQANTTVREQIGRNVQRCMFFAAKDGHETWNEDFAVIVQILKAPE